VTNSALYSKAGMTLKAAGDMSFNGELRGLTVWQRGLAPGEVRQRFQETPGRR